MGLRENVNIVKILTVDRSKQHIEKYLNSHYNNIMDSEIWVQVIKLVDKIDNMFTLCLNQDEKKRSEYLHHIEKYILPLANKCSPEIINYLIELINNCKLVGFKKFN